MNHEVFVNSLIKCMEDKIKEGSNKVPSTYFKPSGMHCPRVMYFVGKGYQPEPSQVHYNWQEAANTGSLRHEAIQKALEYMTAHPEYGWSYIDVGEYIENKHKEGKCLDVEVGSKQGMETHLYNKRYNLSFLCDGIVRYEPTGEYFLFEFKNKKSKLFEKERYSFPQEHYDQVVVYCMCLDLEKAFLVMENRDTLELSCPETFIVTNEMKEQMKQKIDYVLNRMTINELPEKPIDANCFFCQYKKYCQ